MPVPAHSDRARPAPFARLALLGLFGLSVLAPAATLAADPAGDAIPMPPGVTAGGTSVALAEAPAATREALSGAGLLDGISVCSAVLIRPAAGDPPEDAPAYALTNGHCANVFDATGVVQDESLPPGVATIAFGVDDVGQPLVTVPVESIRWATMKGTDLAVLELAEPLADLLAAGIAAYPISVPAEPGTAVVVVGGPTPPDGGGRILRLAACTTGPGVDLFEHHWAWSAFPSNDCADILPGSSGSPVLDPATGALVGLVNTTTEGSAGMSDCALGRPCEVAADAARSREGASYGPAVDVLAGCFDERWVFLGPGGACALDPGIGVVANGWTLSSNPGATRVSGDWTSPGTWQADLQGTPGIAFMRTATGRAGRVDCHDAAAYGAPEPLPSGALYDAPLPEEDGHWLLCVLGGPDASGDEGWQSPRHPTILRVDIDRVPPIVEPEVMVQDVGEAWLVDPVFRAPELTMFDWKWGPADTTDCADHEGYAAYQGFPVNLPFADAPTRLCVIGYDVATNRSPTVERVLTAP